MLKRISIGLILLFSALLIVTTADKEKKAYELIYQDIQILKQQILKLDSKIDNNSTEIAAIHEKLTELLSLSRLSRNEQAGILAEQKKLPVQYQVLLERYDSINNELAKITEKLIEIQQAAQAAAFETGGEETNAEFPPPEQEGTATDQTDTNAAEETEQTKTTLPPNLSPQEVFNMARSDYLKGNFQLAIEGFLIYREHFPESPLADNALYQVGESYFSQEKYTEAIEQFNGYILDYPQGDKITASYYKKGLSLIELEKIEEAVSVFKLLINKFPYEEEAKMALQKLQELGY